nr:hypothetical protein [Kibdelosporangium sp. MJ126-NF4]CEL23136.1 hypothetical protein [Kibdelosporangium sp. MJ126-NF4]CTQ90274.1 hypothetical protein [Kibdelosporangium sp. MJ126-NF4]
MAKRLSTILLATVATGMTLLAACGQADSGNAAGATTPPPSATSTATSSAAPTSKQAVTSGRTSTTAKAPTGNETAEPVTCGPVDLPSGAKHNLIADSTADGRVGCTEAFNVFDEFVKLPKDKRDKAALGDVKLSNGWSCTLDDGASGGLSCLKGRTADKPGIALHTKPV